MNIAICTVIRKDLKVDIPTAQWVSRQLVRRQAAGEPGWLVWDACPSNYIDAARNYLVECHRRADAILFLDSDVVPPADGLSRLIELDVPIAVGLCPIVVNGRDGWNVAIQTASGREYLPRLTCTNPRPFRIVRGGTAFMLIHATVFDRVGWPWFNTVMRHATKDSPELVAMTDDEWFCDRAVEAGLEIWADPNVTCQHS